MQSALTQRFLSTSKQLATSVIGTGRNAMDSSRFNSSPPRYLSYETLKVSTVADYVTHVELHRPDKLNAMNKAMWTEILDCFNTIHNDPKCRVVVLSGSGKMFTAGLDLGELGMFTTIMESGDDIARKCKAFYNMIVPFQQSFSSLEKCQKPVIGAIHGGCVGGGVDLICGTDIRYATSDAWFQVKEVDVGLAADVGTLQRLPKVIGNQSLVRELCFTARKMASDEALSSGLVSRIFPDKKALMEGVIQLATTIASKSPVAVQGTKINLVYSRDHSVEESLQFQSIWNQSMLQSNDLLKSAMAMMSKEKAQFDDY